MKTDEVKYANAGPAEAPPSVEPKGRWALAAGLVAAFAGWAGLAVMAIGQFGWDALKDMSPLLIGGVALVAFSVGLCVILASALYRETLRSRASNRMIETAAYQLLSPAEEAIDKIHSLGFAVSRISRDVCANIDTARERMADLNVDLAKTLGATAHTVKAVRVTGGEVITGIDEQRRLLETTRSTIRGDAEQMSHSVRETSNLLLEAAARASETISDAEQRLNYGAETVDEAADRLAGRLGSLEQITADGRKRTMALIYALARINEQMDQSAKKVDAAVKAGDMAALASKNTAEALNQAVSNALQSALTISEKIEASSSVAREEAESALRRLTEAGVRLETVTRTARGAAEEHAHTIEERFLALSHSIADSADRAANTAEYRIRNANQRMDEVAHLADEAGNEGGLEDTEEARAWADVLESMSDEVPDLSDIFPSFAENEAVSSMMKAPVRAETSRVDLDYERPAKKDESFDALVENFFEDEEEEADAGDPAPLV